MAKKVFGNNFSHDWFVSRGYVKNAKGGYDPPPFKHKVFKADESIPVKEVVSETPDFQHQPIMNWFIPYSVPSKKNSRLNFVKNGKQISIPSKRHQEYVIATKPYWVAFGKEFARSVAILNLTPPLRVEFTFVRSSKHRFDYTNSCQTCEDLMVDFNWLPDDSADHLIPSFAPYLFDKENPGVKIKLLNNV